MNIIAAVTHFVEALINKFISRTDYSAGSIFILAEWVMTGATYFFRAQPEYNGHLVNFTWIFEKPRNKRQRVQSVISSGAHFR